MLREVLKHDEIEPTLVEIDADVIKFCRTHLPTLSDGAFDDPRARIVVADGAEFMKSDGPAFDVIIVDSTDPIGPGAVLFTADFYGACRNRLAPGGILVTQGGVPMIQGAELKSSITTLRRLFADASCYLAPVPTYFGGFMAFGWASDNPGLRACDLAQSEARYGPKKLATRYYTPAIHGAAFSLPTYVSELMDS